MFTVRTLLDKQSVQLFKEEFARAAQLEGEAALERIARDAEAMLGQLDRARGHDFLATLWTHTPVSANAEGDLFTEIFSGAEEMTFYSRSGRDRSPDARYPIEGAKLLELLEAGARPHDITPRDPNGVLVFEPSEVRRQSGPQLSRVHGLTDSFFSGGGATVTTQFVRHPGFAGNRFIATTRLLIEQGLALEAETTANRIAARLK